MRGIAGARLSPGNQKGQRNSRSGDYRLASIELQGTGAGIPEVGGGAWEQSHPRRAGSERTTRILQPWSGRHWRSSGRGKVQAAIGPRLRPMGEFIGLSSKVFFLTDGALLIKLLGHAQLLRPCCLQPGLGHAELLMAFCVRRFSSVLILTRIPLADPPGTPDPAAPLVPLPLLQTSVRRRRGSLRTATSGGAAPTRRPLAAHVHRQRRPSALLASNLGGFSSN